jgi:hypothetical protein
VPGIVDVVPVETVEPLVSRHERELVSMRRELEEAVREAEAAEERLNRHPAAAVYDDAFEADVLAHVAQSLSTVRRGPLAGTAGGAGEAARTAAVPEQAAPPPPVFEAPPVRRAAAPPGVARTVVVDRSAPRTVVVDRRGPADRSRESSPPPPPSPSVLAGDPGAEQFISSQANVQTPAKAERKRRSGKTKGHRAARLSSRVLIQAGVVVVIVALLLLKLS